MIKRGFKGNITKITQQEDEEGMAGYTVLSGYAEGEEEPVAIDKIPTPIMQAIAGLKHYLANSDLQKLMKKVMADNGRQYAPKQATSFLERHTPGFKGYSWLPLLVSTTIDKVDKKEQKPNARRYFKFNSQVWKGVAVPTTMLTGVNAQAIQMPVVEGEQEETQQETPKNTTAPKAKASASAAKNTKILAAMKAKSTDKSDHKAS